MSVTTGNATTRVTRRRIVPYVLEVVLVGIVLALLGALGNLLAPDAGFRQPRWDLTDLAGLEATGGWTSASATLLTVLVWRA